jgi:hypothetical protein
MLCNCIYCHSCGVVEIGTKIKLVVWNAKNFEIPVFHVKLIIIIIIISFCKNLIKQTLLTYMKNDYTVMHIYAVVCILIRFHIPHRAILSSTQLSQTKLGGTV